MYSYQSTNANLCNNDMCEAFYIYYSLRNIFKSLKIMRNIKIKSICLIVAIFEDSTQASVRKLSGVE